MPRAKKHHPPQTRAGPEQESRAAGNMCKKKGQRALRKKRGLPILEEGTGGGAQGVAKG